MSTSTCVSQGCNMVVTWLLHAGQQGWSNIACVSNQHAKPILARQLHSTSLYVACQLVVITSTVTTQAHYNLNNHAVNKLIDQVQTCNMVVPTMAILLWECTGDLPLNRIQAPCRICLSEGVNSEYLCLLNSCATYYTVNPQI